MPNYSVALGVQPPQINPLQAYSLASQLQRNQLATQQAQHSMSVEDQRLELAKQAAARQQQAASLDLAERQAKKNALAQYSQASAANDPNALAKLSAYPALQSQVLQVRGQLAENDKAAFDQKMMRNARRAQYVAGLSGDARTQAWQQQLHDALSTGDISQQVYDQYATQQPNDLMLHNIMQQAVPIQQIYQQTAPTPTQRNLESAGIKPGTPEYTTAVTGGRLLPKFEKLPNGKLMRVDPVSGEVTDVTPPGLESETGMFKTPQDRLKYEQNVRKEYITTSKTFQDVRDAAARVEASAKDPTPAGDLALIFNFMKVLDPGSVVRESEFANAAASGSYGERIQGYVNSIVSGQRLSDAIRQDFVNRTRQLYHAQENQFSKLTDQYRNIAQAAGVKPEDVIVDLSPAPGNFPEQNPAPPGQAAPENMPHPRNKQEFDALPSGTPFIDPEGNHRIKP